MANRPIPVNDATDMMAAYDSYMSSLGVVMTKQTQSVSFTSAELLRWMEGVASDCDEFRICLGVYPPGHAQAGRITTIVWPYKNGKPSTEPDTEGKNGGPTVPKPPYNEGSGNP